MAKALAVLAATGLVVLGVTALAGAAGSDGASPTTPTATVIAVLGPKMSVRPGKFAKAYAVCPKGYYVTGGGAYSGAITEIISSPMPNLRGWFVDGSNTSPAKRTFQHRADAVCQKGSPASSATTAATDASLTRQAQTDFAVSHGALRHR
jgi:hypothetical protein